MVVGGPQYRVVDSGRDDVIPPLLPQEIRSRWELWQRWKIHLFQPSRSGRQMNAAIYTGTHECAQCPSGPIAVCERGFFHKSSQKVSLENIPHTPF